MLQLHTLNDILFTLAGSHRERAVLVQDKAGTWFAVSSDELVRRVRSVAAALRRWGIGKGDRVAILAENRWEWAVADFACLAVGAVDVPLYPTLLADQIRPLLADSHARILFVSTRAQYEKVASLLGSGALEQVVVMDEDPMPGAVPFSSPSASPPCRAMPGRWASRVRQRRSNSGNGACRS